MNLRIPLMAMILIAAFPGSVCGANQLLENPIANPGKPWAFWGFVVDTPALNDLYSMSKDSTQARIGLLVSPPDHTLLFTAAAQKLDHGLETANQLVVYISQRRKEEADPTRYREPEFSHKELIHEGAQCVRYSSLAEDLGLRADEAVPLITQGISCIHPASPEFVVDVSYSERGGGRTISDQFRHVAEEYLKSLRFIPLPGRPEIVEALRLAMDRKGKEALKILDPMVEAGDTQAALAEAEMYLFGRGVRRSYKIAREMLARTTADGIADAYYSLGVIYANGQAVKRDDTEAVKWYRLAADQRHADAQWNLAYHYNEGKGVPKDVPESDNWVRMAADNGHEFAKRALGWP